jgi:hypothetical protein
LYVSTQNLLNFELKLKKANFLEEGKSLFFKKDLLFVNLDEDKVFKQGFFKKDQPVTTFKKSPFFDKNTTTFTKTFNLSKYESFNNFFKTEVIKNFNNHTTNISHPDLDDETRIVKRNSGKNTPIRILKCPNSTFFTPNSLTTENFELFRFRFNEKKPTIVNKPVRPTVYLTFKQKRYNQRNNIGKKNETYFDKDLGKSQKYSGNPFLKNMSIIEENFGNPTKQYRLVKKAKSRLDTTRVAS